MISRTVTDFIGHTEQVLENNIFWSKIDSGFREPTQHPPIGYQKQASKYFFFLETTISNQANVWVGQTRKIVGNTLCQYLNILVMFVIVPILHDNKRDAVCKDEVSITTGPLDKYHKTQAS